MEGERKEREIKKNMKEKKRKGQKINEHNNQSHIKGRGIQAQRKRKKGTGRTEMNRWKHMKTMKREFK